MPPPTRLHDPRNAIHLYRHLLREASYLPPLAAPWAISRIKTGFRRWRRDPSPVPRLRKTAGHIRFLFGANAGNRDAMLRVMYLALGRDGKRRRELMVDFRRKEPPSNTAELLAVLNAAPTLEEKMLAMEEQKLDKAAKGKRSKHRESDWLDKWDTDKMLALAKDQGSRAKEAPGRNSIHHNRLKPEEAVPEFNVWGRPFATTTARTKTKKWWMKVAHRILPPIPQGEWDILEKLAEGTAGPEWDAPRRRAVAPDQAPIVPYGIEDAATKPVRMLERHNSRRRKLMEGTETEADAAQSWNGPALGVHNFTPRFWQRLYRNIWEISATMQNREGVRGAWHIQWGGSKPPVVTPASPVHEGFFHDAEALEQKKKAGRGKRQKW